MRASQALLIAVVCAISVTACGGATPTVTPTAPPICSCTPGPTQTIAPTTVTSTATPAVAPSATAPASTPSATAPASTPSAAPTPTLGPPPPTPTTAPVVTPTPGPTTGPVVIGDPAIDALDSISADTVFYVNWVGPNKSGDYITIVAKGKRKWNGEPYFYTYGGTPRPLQSSTQPGDYELWYVNGA